MKKFKGYLQEMAAIDASDLDSKFLQRAQKVTSFNLSPNDFTNLKYKGEIQFLFKTHFFPKFDLDKTIKGKPSTDALNNLIKKIKNEDKKYFKALHNYNLKGVGPGEATLYFLLDDAHLGGGTASAADIQIGSQAYEVKAGDIGGDGFFKNFKLGGTVPMDKMVGAGLRIRDSDQRIQRAGREVNGVNAAQIKMIMANPALRKEWENEVEKPYRIAAHKYLSKNPLILMVNKTPAAKMGEVAFIGNLKREQIYLDVITQGTIKPKVKL